MKILLLFLLALFTLNADDTKQSIIMGLGAYVQTQPYKDVDNILLPSPVVFFDNGMLYIRWTRAGLYFLGEKKEDYAWAFSLTGQPRPNGYQASDSEILQGMEDKESSLEAGLAFSAAMGKSHIEAMILTDIIYEYDAWIAKIEIGYDFEFGDLKLYPSIIAQFQSSAFMNYYYGVNKKETLNSTNAYFSSKSDTQLGVQTYINYKLTDTLSALINLRVDKMPNEATRSPLVNDEYLYSGLASLIYTYTME